MDSNIYTINGTDANGLIIMKKGTAILHSSPSNGYTRLRPHQKQLLNLILKKGRLLNEDEIFNFYFDNVKSTSCRTSWFHDKTREHDKQEIHALAMAFYLRALGKMVQIGELRIFV